MSSDTFGSLFSGIGGIDLGLERAGWTCRWQVEVDPFCRHVLEHHWPDVPRYGDITGIDWSTVERVDLLAGGFPCQPISQAGRKHAQDDDRWLWPEFARAIRDLRPRLVLVENVQHLLAVDRGGAFREVLGDLASLGYDAEWDCVPAATVGAWHLRDRLWLVAYPNGDGLRDERGRGGRTNGQGEAQPLDDGATWPLADPASTARGLHAGQGRSGPAAADGRGLAQVDADAAGAGLQGQEPAGRIWGRGLLAQRDRWGPEPEVARVVHGVPDRVVSTRALGNACVPQVVEMIGRMLR